MLYIYISIVLSYNNNIYIYIHCSSSRATAIDSYLQDIIIILYTIHVPFEVGFDFQLEHTQRVFVGIYSRYRNASKYLSAFKAQSYRLINGFLYTYMQIYVIC